MTVKSNDLRPVGVAMLLAEFEPHLNLSGLRALCLAPEQRPLSQLDQKLNRGTSQNAAHRRWAQGGFNFILDALIVEAGRHDVGTGVAV